VAEQVAVGAVGLLGQTALSASMAGPIVYRAAAGRARQLMWFDRAGKAIVKLGDLDVARPRHPSLSPDGRRVVVEREVNGNFDLWLLDVERGVPTRFTFDGAMQGRPIWSPRGTRIVFMSNQMGQFDLYQRPVTGAGGEELLLGTKRRAVTDVTDRAWSLDTSPMSGTANPTLRLTFCTLCRLSPARGAIDEFADGPNEALEVAEIVLQDGVHATAVDLQVLMHENVSESGHGRQLFRQQCRHDLLCAQAFEQFFIVGGKVQSHVGNNVVADVQYTLNRELQISLCITVD
jgi:hypothetical protein